MASNRRGASKLFDVVLSFFVSIWVALCLAALTLFWGLAVYFIFDADVREMVTTAQGWIGIGVVLLWTWAAYSVLSIILWAYLWFTDGF
jgi:hypothetical protein